MHSRGSLAGLISVLTAALLSATAGCTSENPDVGGLTIGVMSAITNTDSAAGQDTVNGAQLAVDLLNKPLPSGPDPLQGLSVRSGRKLALATFDTQSQADIAVSHAGALAEHDHASAVILAGEDDVAEAAASRMQELRVPLIDVSNSADYLTELGLDWYFRAGPGDLALAQAAFGLLRDSRAGLGTEPRIAIITDSGGASGAALIANLAARSGVAVAFHDEIAADQGNVAQLAARLEDSAPDVVIGWAESITGADAISRIPGLPVLIGVGQGFQQTAGHPAAPQALRIVAWSAELSTRHPIGRLVMDLYEQRFRRPMTEAAAAAYTAVIAVAVASAAAASADPAAVRSALRQASLPPTRMIMPWSGLHFGSDGANQLAAAVVEAWDGNAFHVVYPAELASQAVPSLRRPG